MRRRQGESQTGLIRPGHSTRTAPQQRPPSPTPLRPKSATGGSAAPSRPRPAPHGPPRNSSGAKRVRTCAFSSRARPRSIGPGAVNLSPLLDLRHRLDHQSQPIRNLSIMAARFKAETAKLRPAYVTNMS